MNIQNNKPKFYRQRFLLSLLRFINTEVTRTELQKHSFLFSQQAPMGYDFVPYQYGCYSFQLDKDLLNLSERGFIEIVDSKIKLKVEKPALWLRIKDSNSLFKYPDEQKRLKGNALVVFVYKNYPYYATKSQITNICPSGVIKQIRQEKEKLISFESTIYTIGYEGITLEAYINKLIKNNIKLIGDIRKNPFSRKFGFSYKALNDILPKLDIEYVHIPQLGVESNKRQDLNNKEDYKKLFDEYKTTLPAREEALNKVLDLQKKHRRIALTCFEKHHHDCHRHCVTDYLSDNYKTQTIHL
ncbi:DUF488 family protein [Candidatus Spongiihabitans sp.]|uniref:DUF488 domain-containing protein n=1 Tax=Candidatus Spongiihabitans sp. TaxID=3101308 RepID=UPI003C7037CE